jgi:hypothetical protein
MPCRAAGAGPPRQDQRLGGGRRVAEPSRVASRAGGEQPPGLAGPADGQELRQARRPGVRAPGGRRRAGRHGRFRHDRCIGWHPPDRHAVPASGCRRRDQLATRRKRRRLLALPGDRHPLWAALRSGACGPGILRLGALLRWTVLGVPEDGGPASPQALPRSTGVQRPAEIGRRPGTDQPRARGGVSLGVPACRGGVDIRAGDVPGVRPPAATLESELLL